MASPIRRAGRLTKADPSTILDKFLVGYQGWFTCAGDGPPLEPGHHGWIHWFDAPLPDGGRPTIDLWPDVSEYSPSELYPAPGLSLPSSSSSSSSSAAANDSSTPTLFSSRNPTSVRRHFHWMAQHGVSGAFLQRFAGQCEVDGGSGGNAAIMALRDQVGRHVRRAAEDEGRVWAVMYDVSGVPASRILHVLTTDWAHLLSAERVLASPAYLHEAHKPVLALWGFGFAERGHTPALVRDVVRALRALTPGGALYVMAGAPAHWRTGQGDADPDPGFLDVWLNEFDAISPWSVGRYADEDAADAFARENVRKDMALLGDGSRQRRGAGGMSARKVDYVPVVFPGFSGINLSEGKWGFNEIPRDGGRFLWRQIFNVRKEGAGIIYGAMWDEYDEGTAFMPVVSYKRQLPQPGRFLALDEDGYDLPSDWYMRISGFASDILRGERTLQEPFPVKDLQDYWSHRPKYDMEDLGSDSGGGVASGSGSGSAAGAGGDEAVTQSFDEWLAAEKEEKDDLPPPPYSLEAEEGAVVDETVLVNANTNTNTNVSPSSNSGSTVAGAATVATTNTNTNAVPDHGPAAQGQQGIPPNASPQTQTQTQTQTRPASLPVPPSTNPILASRPNSVASAQSSFSAGSASGAAYTPPSRVSSLSAAQRPAGSASVQSGLAHRPSLQAASSGAVYSHTGTATATVGPPSGASSYAGQYQQTPAVGYQQQQGADLGRYNSYHSVSSAVGLGGGGGPGMVDALSNDFNRQSLADAPPTSSHIPITGQPPYSPYAPHGSVLGAAASAVSVSASAQGQFSSPVPHAEAHLHHTQTQQGAGYAHPASPPVQWPPPEWALPDTGSGSGPNRLSPPALPTSARPPPPPQHPSRPARPPQQNQNQNQNQNQGYAPPRPGGGGSGSTYPNQYRPPPPPPQAPIAPNAAYQAPPPQPQQPWAAFPQPNTISPQFAAAHVPFTAHMPTPPPRTSSLDQGGYGAGPGMPTFPGANLNMHVPPPLPQSHSQPSGYGATPGFFDGQFPESQGPTPSGYPPAASSWSAPSPNGYPPRISSGTPTTPPGGPIMPMPHSSSSSSVLPGRLGDVGSGLFGQTLGRAVDRLAGEDTRKRLESGVDQLKGSKIYQKFMK